MGIRVSPRRWQHGRIALHASGFTVLVPAQRAHEMSEGRYTGMGWLERNDLLNWIHLIIEAIPKPVSCCMAIRWARQR